MKWNKKRHLLKWTRDNSFHIVRNIAINILVIYLGKLYLNSKENKL
jgi:hypothetical protein